MPSPLSKTITLSVEEKNFERKAVDCDVETMTGAQLYAKLAEPQYAPDLKDGGGKALVKLVCMPLVSVLYMGTILNMVGDEW